MLSENTCAVVSKWASPSWKQYMKKYFGSIIRRSLIVQSLRKKKGKPKILSETNLLERYLKIKKNTVLIDPIKEGGLD